MGVNRAGDYKSHIIRNCKYVIHPLDKNKKGRDFEDVVKCAIELGKRQFALEIFPSVVLDLALDRSHIYKTDDDEKPKKKRWFGI